MSACVSSASQAIFKGKNARWRAKKCAGSSDGGTRARSGIQVTFQPIIALFNVFSISKTNVSCHRANEGNKSLRLNKTTVLSVDAVAFLLLLSQCLIVPLFVFSIKCRIALKGDQKRGSSRPPGALNGARARKREIPPSSRNWPPKIARRCRAGHSNGISAFAIESGDAARARRARESVGAPRRAAVRYRRGLNNGSAIARKVTKVCRRLGARFSS